MPLYQEDQHAEAARAPVRPARDDAETARPAASGTAEQQRILALQRSVGNQAVVHALRHGATAHRQAPGADRAPGLTVQRADDGRLPGVLRNDQRSEHLMQPETSDQQRLEAAFPRNADGTFVRFPNPVGPPREREGENEREGGGESGRQNERESGRQNERESGRENEREGRRRRRRGRDPLALTQGLVRGLSRAISRIGLREQAESAVPGSPEQTDTATSGNPRQTDTATTAKAAYVEPAEWVTLINPRRDEGGAEGPYRRNCIDTVRSFVASWSGNPTVAAGVESEGVEPDGNNRTARWLNTDAFRDPDRFTMELPDVQAREITSAWQAVHSLLQRRQHGTLALVVFHPDNVEHDFGHAICAVNYQGQVLWVDAQRGTVSTTPMYTGTNVLTVVLNPRFEVVEPPAPNLGISLD